MLKQQTGTTKPSIKIRWLDVEEASIVARISRASLPEHQAMDSTRIVAFADTPDHVPKVILANGEIVGFMFFVLHNRVINIRQIAIDPAYRHRGYGLRLVRHLCRQLRTFRRRIIVAKVPEEAYVAQCMFRKAGFKAFQVLDLAEGTFYPMKYVGEPNA